MKGEWCYFKNHVSKRDCEQIIKDLKDDHLFTPNIGFEGSANDTSIRDGQITWVTQDKHLYLFDEIWRLAKIANSDWFGFDLIQPECVQFSRYPAGQGFYHKHQDVFWLNSSPHHRKLTCVIQLSEPDQYTGGDLCLYDCEQFPNPEDIRSQGTVIFFPSFIFHEVAPVLTGERYSLVSWIYGPKWK